MPKNTSNTIILYIDSYCMLCNRIYLWIAARDKKHLIQFCPLSSHYAKRQLPQSLYSDNGEKAKSLILQKGDSYYDRSTAVIEVGKVLGGLWSASVIFYVLPKGFRDALYMFISRNRYRWFKRAMKCYLQEAGASGNIIID